MCIAVREAWAHVKRTGTRYPNVRKSDYGSGLPTSM